IEKANKVNIKPVIAETVSADAKVVTDGFGAYRGLDKLHQAHHVLNKEKEEYVKGEYHTNTLEGFWTLLKRGIYGQYHKVSSEHLQAYLDEFTFKYNNRTNKSNFALLIQRSLTFV
ncbi:ISXO2-like transposase domain-containing protein, partial [Mucilaginibacter gossypiicola]